MHAVDESHKWRMDAVAEQPLRVLARLGYPFTTDRQTEVLLLSTPWGAVLGSNAHSRGGGSVAETTLIGFSREAELRTTLDREPAAVRQLRSPDYIVDRYRTALSMVAAGMGVMAVPAIIAPAVPRGAKLLDLVHRNLQRTMGLLVRPDASPSTALEDLVAQILKRVSQIRGVRPI